MRYYFNFYPNAYAYFYFRIKHDHTLIRMSTKLALVLSIAICIFCGCKSEKKSEISKRQETSFINKVEFSGGPASSLPVLFSNSENAILSWVTMLDDSTSQLNYAYLQEDKWSTPNEIITDKGWFVNWADFPSITENNGTLLAHFLKKTSPATFSYDINLSLKPKGKSEWVIQNKLHTDGTKTEHGFVTALPYKDDSFFVTWLDGRETAGGSNHHHSGHGGDMTIRSATVSSSGAVTDRTLLDNKTCSCCQTTAAITRNGPVVLYRDRTDQEIRDIAITRLVNGKWTTPKPIHNDGWEINGCPVNGPKASAIGNSLAVAWYTGANERPSVKIVFSQNGGEDFSTPVEVSGPNPLGRVDVELIDPENAIVSWMEKTGSSTYIKAAKVNIEGKRSPSVTISKLDGSRKTGFPQMCLFDNKLYFAWTALENNSSTIASAYLELDSFSILQ